MNKLKSKKKFGRINSRSWGTQLEDTKIEIKLRLLLIFFNNYNKFGDIVHACPWTNSSKIGLKISRYHWTPPPPYFELFYPPEKIFEAAKSKERRKS
jgi:hypothetical protein